MQSWACGVDLGQPVEDIWETEKAGFRRGSVTGGWAAAQRQVWGFLVQVPPMVMDWELVLIPEIRTCVVVGLKHQRDLSQRELRREWEGRTNNFEHEYCSRDRKNIGLKYRIERVDRSVGSDPDPDSDSDSNRTVAHETHAGL
jgi:hypothetical protein